jgi:hypothetical protein
MGNLGFNAIHFCTADWPWFTKDTFDYPVPGKESLDNPSQIGRQRLTAVRSSLTSTEISAGC